MAKVLIVYWSMTGNTEKMAQLIQQGAEAAGAETVCKHVAEATPDEISNYDRIALGCPSMGAEELDEEMLQFVDAIEGKLSGKKLALFGSYGWGDGQWMRDWAARMDSCGASLIGEGLIVQETPEGESAEQCVALGTTLAA